MRIGINLERARYARFRDGRASRKRTAFEMTEIGIMFDYIAKCGYNNYAMEEKEKKHVKWSKKRTRFIAYSAVFSAISVILNAVTIPFAVSGFAITFTYIPNFFAGALLGPFAGLLVGLIGDSLGFAINPTGIWNPFVFVSSGLIGLISGLIFHFGKKILPDVKARSFILTAVSFAFIFLIASNLNTIGLWLYYGAPKGKTLAVYYIGRTPKVFAMVLANFIICMGLIMPMEELYRALEKKS